MIGYLRGLVIERHLPEVWIDVNGVGYRVRVGERIGAGVTTGEEAELYIYTSVREDAIDLYGFESRKEMRMFEMFLDVSGVGPKTALGIVGSKSIESIERAVSEADVAFFTSISGIGKKGAQRILVDIKGKLPRLKELDLSDEGEASEVVMDALTQFGFSKSEVRMVLSDMDENLSEEEQIREGLKRLGRR